jgi:acid phosphatase
MQSCFRPAWPGLIAFAVALAGAALPRPDHVVIAIYENHGDSSVVGSPKAPYINSLAADAYAARFTQSYALTHPSQPNYIMLFSGSNQGVTSDDVPANLPFKTANLGAALLAKGVSFHAYSEDLPSTGFTGATDKAYARKHAPWVNWQDAPANGIPARSHEAMAAFPSDYSKLATVTFVVPNLQHDMHEGTVEQGDAWLKANLDGYIRWAKAHNSLFILTFDEDENTGGGGTNRIPTLFVGQMVKKGAYSSRITHYEVLRTLEDMYGTSHSGAAADAKPISEVWLPATGMAPRLEVPYMLPWDAGRMRECRADGRAMERGSGTFIPFLAHP